ncbi:MAG: hypothetical protein IIB54_08670, partial [Planctomycetes bacterium]|nr:hypothetical protein [Planctomycetota bacterium]
MRIHHISSRKRSSLLVALLCLMVSDAEGYGQCAVTSIPVGDGATLISNSPVDLDGDIAVIGDMSDEPFGFRSGSVKVRRFNGSVWVEEAILTASNGALGDWFGTRVAISGEVIAVAAFAFNNPVNAVGAAYIYRYNPTTMVWEEEAILTRQTAAPASNSGFFGANLALDHSGFFGANLALDGDVVAIAGLTVNGAGENIMGAHIFRYNPTTIAWEFEQVVTIADSPGALLPNNWMALDGNVLIAGEPFASFDIGKGAAWIYRFDGATWNLDVKISSPTTTSISLDFFGVAVDVKGDMAVIGVPNDSDLPSGGTVGAVYVYEYDGANWNFSQKVVPANTAPLEYRFFGTSLSLAVDAMLVGTISE